MAINKGNIKTSVNYNLEAQKPLDARAERPTKADLHKKESWSSDGDTIYIHEGQITYTEQEKKLFLLKDVKNFESEEAWAQILTTDDEIQGGGSDITVDSAMSESSTNPVQNRVVKKYVDDAINNIPPQEPTVDVIDNLDSTDTEAALSANQGRILNEKIEAVANEATKIFNVKGSCKYSELPTTNNAVGDVYNITDSFTIGSENYPAGTNVVWDGANWDALGGSIDLSAYATTETVVAMVQEETDRARGAETRIQKEITTIKVNVANKVTKEDGKGLSDENFTSALKKKLDAFKNPEDYALQTQIESLQSQLDALTNDDSIDEVIAKYEELKAFLEGLGNDEYGAFIEEISNQIAELGKGLTDANKRIDSVEERLEDLASEIVIDEKEVYIGDDEPTDAKIWIDTDEEYEGGGNAPSGGGGSVAVDAELSLTSENPVQNKVVSQYVGKRVVDADILNPTGWDEVVALYESLSQLGRVPIIQCKCFNSIADVLGVSTKSGEKYILLYAEGRTFYFSRNQDILSLPFTINLDGITEREYALFSTAFFVLLITSDSGNLWAKKGGKLYPVTRLYQGLDENGDAMIEVEICSGNFFHTYRLELFESGIIPVKHISSKYAGWEIPVEALDHSENDPYMFSGDELEHLVNMFTEALTPIVLGSDFGYLYPSATMFEYYEEDDVWIAYVEFPQTQMIGSSAIVLIEYWVESKEMYAYQIDGF